MPWEEVVVGGVWFGLCGKGCEVNLKVLFRYFSDYEKIDMIETFEALF